jgi:hypothetical protein
VVTARGRDPDLVRDSLSGVAGEDPALEIRIGGDKVTIDSEPRQAGRDWPAGASSTSGELRVRQSRRGRGCARDGRGRRRHRVRRGEECLHPCPDGARRLGRHLAYGTERRFARGLPEPDAARYRQDAGSQLHRFDPLAVPLEAVRATVTRSRLLDEPIFRKGRSRDTLPREPVERLAVLCFDRDLDESTVDALAALHD